MDRPEITFQREQLDWQKRRFMLNSFFVMTGAILAIMTVFLLYFSVLRAPDRTAHILERTTVDIAELATRQDELYARIAFLDGQLNDVMQYSRSLHDSIAPLEDLVTALKQSVEDLRGEG